jgi:hypothetical protein
MWRLAAKTNIENLFSVEVVDHPDNFVLRVKVLSAGRSRPFSKLTYRASVLTSPA